MLKKEIAYDIIQKYESRNVTCLGRKNYRVIVIDTQLLDIKIFFHVRFSTSEDAHVSVLVVIISYSEIS